MAVDCIFLTFINKYTLCAHKMSQHFRLGSEFFRTFAPEFERHTSSRDEHRREKAIKRGLSISPTTDRVYEKISEEFMSELFDSYPDVPERRSNQKRKRKFRNL